MSHYHQCKTHLDRLLRTLPQDELPMTLCEFDGFATGLLACPEDIPINQWLPELWGSRGLGQAPDQGLQTEITQAILAYVDIIAHGLSQTGRVRPSYLGHGQTDGEIWEAWIDGYLRAAALRPSVWQDFYEQADEDVQSLMSFLQTLHDIFTGRSRLSASQVLEIDRMAPEAIAPSVTFIIKHSRPDRLPPKAANLSKGPPAGRSGQMSPDRSGRPG